MSSRTTRSRFLFWSAGEGILGPFVFGVEVGLPLFFFVYSEGGLFFFACVEGDLPLVFL